MEAARLIPLTTLAALTLTFNARAAEPLQASVRGWTVVSMKGDWKQIFAFKNDQEQ